MDRDTLNSDHNRSNVAWRWTLIGAELLVAGHTAYSLWVGRSVRFPTGGFPLIDIAVAVAWVFLFLGSPFLVSSQRGLAVLGWVIAVATLFLAGLR